jgi:hypothetical protein
MAGRDRDRANGRRERVMPVRRDGRPEVITLAPAGRKAELPSLATATVADAEAELRAWGSAVVHLHSLGLPAAVPEFPAAWLRRRGIRVDWVTAA